MKYSKEDTLLHPIAQKYHFCVKDLNLIIRKDLKSSADLFTEVETIDLDDVQEKRAIELRKDKDSSVDTCFVASNGAKKVILVELKLGIESVNTHFGNSKKRKKFLKKFTDSITLLGGEPPIHNKYYVVFNPDVLQEAKRRLYQIGKEFGQDYIVLSIEELKQTFFS
ncbi:hypothetical protein [Capnocytophaga gingivalis]|jgi:hypothetical protein